MSDIPSTDHEALVTLGERVRQHQTALDQLDVQGRDQSIQLARLSTHVEGLQQSHTLLLTAIDDVKQQQAAYQERTAQQFVNLDNKMDASNTDLRNHFDEKFDTMRREVTQTMDQKEAAVPQWAQVRLTGLSVAVGILGVLAGILSVLHVI